MLRYFRDGVNGFDGEHIDAENTRAVAGDVLTELNWDSFLSFGKHN